MPYKNLFFFDITYIPIYCNGGEKNMKRSKLYLLGLLSLASLFLTSCNNGSINNDKKEDDNAEEVIDTSEEKEEEKYTIIFKDEDGTVLEEHKDIKYGEYSVYEGDIPTKKSTSEYKYKFAGWTPTVGSIKEDTVYTATYDIFKLNESDELTRVPTKEKGQIFIFGERHGYRDVHAAQLKARDYYYNELGYRDVLVEFSAVSAEKFNLFMEEDNDKRLIHIFNNFVNSNAQANSIYYFNFFMTIKQYFPETRFYGCDMTTSYNGSNIESYVDSLIREGLLKEEDRDLQINNFYYSNFYHQNMRGREQQNLREHVLAKNIIYQFNKLNNRNLVGFFGGAHVRDNGSNNYFDDIPSMANILYHQIGNNYYYEDFHETISKNNDDKVAFDISLINDEKYFLGYDLKDINV